MDVFFEKVPPLDALEEFLSKIIEFRINILNYMFS